MALLIAINPPIHITMFFLPVTLTIFQYAVILILTEMCIRDSNKVTILIDADGCPVVDLTVQTAGKYKVPVLDVYKRQVLP